MRSLSISAADTVYRCSEHLELRRHSVEYPEFEEFSFALRAFERSLGEASEHEYWKEFLWPLRVYGFRLLAAPLPSGHTTIYDPDTVTALRKYLADCGRIYPELTQPAHRLLELKVSLAEADSSPLLDAVWELALEAWEDGRTVALLVKNQRLAAASETVLSKDPDLRNMKVAVPAQMRGGECYGRIIAAGSDRWFPEHVFSAPRAREIYLLHYSWINNNSGVEPLFRGSAAAVRSWSVEGVSEIMDSRRHLPAEELVPVFDWSEALAKAQRNGPEGAAAEAVGARLSLLEGGWAVFLEAEDSATVQAIDLEEEKALQLKRVPVRGLEPGMFIILRTEGGGDYIVPLADRILGEAAANLRDLQKEWKTRLRRAVNFHGLSGVAGQLRRYGSTKATEQNVRNWMSPRNIKTSLYEDFAAIMRLTQLEDSADKYWNAMRVILRAHMKAGFRIRKLLLEEVLESDPEELEKYGRKDFNLTEAAGAALTAFRLEEISKETVMVSPSRIGEPFELEGSLWQR